MSKEVYEFLQESERKEQNQKKRDKEHLDGRELTDHLMEAHGFRRFPDVAEQYITQETVKRVFDILQTCTPAQKRRFLLHYVYGLSFVELAALEGCTETPIRKSVRQVKEKILKNT